MRHQTLKLTKKNSTVYERRFAELLKRAHVPFRAKVKVCGREVDFIVGEYAIDIDGHPQDAQKNELLVEAGFVPLHFFNNEIDEILTNLIKKIWD